MSHEGKVVAKCVRGKVKWYDAQKCYGFISRDDADDLFVHRSALSDRNRYNRLFDGAVVEFDLVEGTKGLEASNVVDVDDIRRDEDAERFRGKVKWFDAPKGFGFITRGVDGQDCFVHRTDIFAKNPDHYDASLLAGEDVEFEVIQGARGPEAWKVTGPGGAAVRGNDDAPNCNVSRRETALELEQIHEIGEENNGDDLTKPFDFADVTFLVEDKRIYYNRGFLAMHSPHFKRLFYGANACHDKEMRLKDKNFDEVLALLKLLKLNPESAEEVISNENVEELLKLAEEYQLRHVTAECEKFLLLKWKFSKLMIVKALELSAKFGLNTALSDLLVKPGDDYPALLTDENVEQILPIAKEFQLANIDYCEKFLLLNWKQSTDKVVRAVELSAKFGLEKALANLLKSTEGMQSNITDGNIEQLLSLCKEYSLFEIRADCEAYIMKNWIKNTEKALRAVEIAHEMNLPQLAKAFIPLAACRPLAEIDCFLDKLSTELFCAIMRASLVRVGDGFDCTPKLFYEPYLYCANCGISGCQYYCCGKRTTERYISSGNQVVYPKHSCGKVKLGSGVSLTNNTCYGTCTCVDTVPAAGDPVVEEMLKRNQSA